VIKKIECKVCGDPEKSSEVVIHQSGICILCRKIILNMLEMDVYAEFTTYSQGQLEIDKDNFEITGEYVDTSYSDPSFSNFCCNICDHEFEKYDYDYEGVMEHVIEHAKDEDYREEYYPEEEDD